MEIVGIPFSPTLIKKDQSPFLNALTLSNIYYAENSVSPETPKSGVTIKDFSETFN